MNALTQRAVSSQLAGLMADCYELGIHHQSKMIRRQWDADGVMKSLPWLRLMNATGSDIYIRPSQPLGIILLDDLTKEGLKAIERDGLGPAAILETSSSNYQAWIKLTASQRPLTCEILTAAAKLLAVRYHADPGAADWRHLGRLAGFTNRKPKRMIQGRAPFVLLVTATGRVAPKGDELLDELEQATPLNARSWLTSSASDPTVTYSSCLQEILGRNRSVWTANPDWSRLDFAIACLLARRGWQEKDIIQILIKSPDLAKRKAGHDQDYLERTVHQAMC